jgi:site-specific recombinase XerC
MTEGTSLVEIGVAHKLVEGRSSPPALFLRQARAAERFFDFFTTNIRNRHSRRAYYNAACKFSEFCAGRGVRDLAHVKPVHVAGYVESLLAGFAKQTIKQDLAAIRMLYDWLIVGQIIDVNPAHAVRGPRHVATKGRTPVLNREEARAVLASIDTRPARSCAHRHYDLDLRPRRAVQQMNVGDHFSRGWREWVRLHERGGKEHEALCIPKLEAYLDAYIAAAGIGDDKDGPCFSHDRAFHRQAQRMTRQDGIGWMRGARQAGIKTRIGNHSMRATGITDYLKSDGTLEHAQIMAAHHEAL